MRSKSPAQNLEYFGDAFGQFVNKITKIERNGKYSKIYFDENYIEVSFRTGNFVQKLISGIPVKYYHRALDRFLSCITGWGGSKKIDGYFLTINGDKFRVYLPQRAVLTLKP